MAELPIITIPDPLLREVSTPVETVNNGVLRLLDDMLETMYEAPGIGLAAVQVGVLKRLVVIDIGDEEDEDAKRPICMINPEIVSRDGEPSLYEEGCLSIPDIKVDVERPSLCTVRFIDRDGKQIELETDGLLAKAIQHEVDHLDGRLIIDHLSRLKREMVIRKFKKLQRTA
ncbi:MAG: peptide deformylase [Pseudomonadota bacterium]